MPSNLEARDLISGFASKVEALDWQDNGSGSGNEPEKPFMMMFLGEGSYVSCPQVAKRLERRWPQYAENMVFVGVGHEGDNFIYHVLDSVSGKVKPSAKSIGDLATELFSADSVFRSTNQLLVYYVLDTSVLAGLDEFAWWCKNVTRLCDDLNFGILDPKEMLFMLIREGVEDFERASRIRTHFAKNGIMPNARGAITVTVISSRLNNHAFLPGWESAYDIITAMVAVSDNPRPEVTSKLFYPGTQTVAYARMERPVREIGQVVCNGLISFLDGHRKTSRSIDIRSESTLSRLGITANRTFSVFDDYVDQQLVPHFPSSEQLAYYPRKEPSEVGDLKAVSERELNDITLGSWDATLQTMIDSSIHEVSHSVGIQDIWKSSITRGLYQNFSSDELKLLAENLNSLKQNIGMPDEPSGNSPVLESATARLRCELSSNALTRDIYFDALAEAGEQAKEFVEAWSALVRSCERLHKIRDDEVRTKRVTEFYASMTQDFIDHNQRLLMDDFDNLHSERELVDFFNRWFDGLLKSNEVFRMAFEDELRRRLDYGGNELDSQETIRRILTGDGVVTYFNANFNMDTLQQAMLIRVKSKLADAMRTYMPEDTYFYDTGQGISAETLITYVLTTENLESTVEEA